MEVLSGNEGGPHYIFIVPLPFSNSLVSSREELILLTHAMIFMAASRRCISIAWFWWKTGLTLTGPTVMQPMKKDLLNSYNPKDTAKSNRSWSSVFM